jgi:hypothetical protein
MIGNEKDIMIGGGGGCGIWLDRYHHLQPFPDCVDDLGKTTRSSLSFDLLLLHCCVTK